MTLRQALIALDCSLPHAVLALTGVLAAHATASDAC